MKLEVGVDMTKELFAEIVLMVVIPFVFVALMIPFIKKIAIQVGAVDIPRGRHIHKEPTPKLGGVAIWWSKCTNEFYINR